MVVGNSFAAELYAGIFAVADQIDDRLAKTRDTMNENIASLRTALALLDEEAGVVSGELARNLTDAVAQLDGIKAYLASDRRMAFNEDGIFRHYPELDAA